MTHCTNISRRNNPLVSEENVKEANLIPLKKPKNSRSGTTAVFFVVIISEATFLFREKQETISEQQKLKNERRNAKTVLSDSHCLI